MYYNTMSLKIINCMAMFTQKFPNRLHILWAQLVTSKNLQGYFCEQHEEYYKPYVNSNNFFANY